jgi:hypothetical protein
MVVKIAEDDWVSLYNKIGRELPKEANLLQKEESNSSA